MELNINHKIIKLVQGDITELDTDAIVNAANNRLEHGGGVAGAISRKAGPSLQKESQNWVAEHGQVATGSAAITGSGNLACTYVIHAVGPVMGSGDEDAKLASATQSALQLAEEHHLNSIAFPAISTGTFGYPVKDCARVMLQTANDFLQGSQSVTNIVFCLWDNQTFSIFQDELKKYTNA